MNETVREWITKADRDDAVRALLVASQLRETILPLFDTAG